MGKSRSLKNKPPSIITVSFNSCQKNCQGCYLNLLKKNGGNVPKRNQELEASDVPRYIRQEKHKVNIDSIYVNINVPADVNRFEYLGPWYPYGEASTMKTVPINMIFPLNLALSDDLYYMSAAIYKRIISVNTFDRTHMDILRSGGLLHLPKTIASLEVSFNSTTIKSKRAINTVINSIKKGVRLRDFPIIMVLLNYVARKEDSSTDKTDTITIILELASMLNYGIIQTEVSRCILAGIIAKTTNIEKTCEKNTLIEFMDNKVLNVGCPYPEDARPCQLKC